MKRWLTALCLWGALTGMAQAAPFVIGHITVTGLKRISAATVMTYLPLTVGERLTSARAERAIEALFKTGFFRDVKLMRQGDTLLVAVRERPAIASIKITGTHVIKSDKLMISLAQVGFVKGRVFNRALLHETTQALRRQYFNRGYYAVRIATTVQPLIRDRVAVTIAVSEGKIARIKQITVVGNSQFKEGRLLGRFKLGAPGLFSFISGNDRYSREKLSADLDNLRNFYLDRGFLRFRLVSTVVAITPSKDWIYITVNVREGHVYRISSYKFLGNLILKPAALDALIGLKAGDVFSRERITSGTQRIVGKLGNRGYAFANVRVVPAVDRANHTVALTFFVEPGERVYVRRIRFIGNTVTQDAVLRRSMRQYEGAWFSAKRIKESLTLIRRLGFFDNVRVTTPPVEGHPSEVDVDVHVKERETGSVVAGIGYSDLYGFFINGSVSYQDLLGTGKQLSVSANTSVAYKNINLTYVNPYYTSSGISRGFNIYDSSFNAAAAYSAAYSESTVGAGVFYGIPIGENRAINIGLAAEQVKLTVNSTSAYVAQQFVAAHGTTNNILKATFGWSRNTLNNAIFPTSGTYQSLSGEAGLPGGNLEYYRLSYLASIFFPFGRQYSLKLSNQWSYGNGYGGTDSLPFFKNFYAGGASSVRGYQNESLGPRDILPPNDPIGGNKRVLATAEFFFPVPGTSANNRSMRFSTFLDAGQVYGPGQRIDLGQIRTSFGVAFDWFSPIAPLSISIARPLNAQPGDQTRTVQFTLGTLFMY
ncbi:MAG TPA: outer membrane protein assembly factor BamA [Acidiferrobacter sp.]|nr:outer membrane protein assembly factor BamA [Acidiferrobacter sp.]